MIKNKETIKILIRDIILNLESMKELNKENKIINNVVRSGLDLMTALNIELEKE